MNRRQFLKAAIAVPITVAIGVRETTGLSEGWLGTERLARYMMAVSMTDAGYFYIDVHDDQPRRQPMLDEHKLITA